MRFGLRLSAFSFFSIFSIHLSAQTNVAEMAAYRNLIKTLYTDANGPEPGKAKYEAAAEVHKKDPAVQQKYGVYEGKGLEYCLSSLKNTNSILKTHAGAHGMLTAHIYQVTDEEKQLYPVKRIYSWMFISWARDK